MRKITLFFLSFFLSFSNFTNCCEQADFKPLSTFLIFNNPQIKKKKQNKHKFKTFFPNAIEISIISTNLIKITFSQITIQKEWRLVSFCENWKQSAKSAKMKNKTNEISFLVCFHHCRKEKKKRLSSSFSSFNKQLPFILAHSISSNQSQSITINHNEKRKRWKWTSSTTIEQIETPSFNARVKRGQANYTPPTTRFSSIL